MNAKMPGRRGVMRGAFAFAATSGAALSQAVAQQATEVRWSTGTEPPKTKAPPNATDCHFHIYDSSFPVAPYATLKPPPASVQDYQSLQRRIGTSCCVMVLPSTYGTDNTHFLALLPQLGGKDRARMVGVVNTSVTDQELRQMHEAGVRGIRFNLAPAGATTVDMIEPLAKRIEPMDGTARSMPHPSRSSQRRRSFCECRDGWCSTTWRMHRTSTARVTFWSGA